MTQLTHTATAETFLGNNYLSLQEMVAQLQAEIAEMMSTNKDVYIGGGNHYLDTGINTLSVDGNGAYVSAPSIANAYMSGDFGYVTTPELTESADLTGDYNGMFARDAGGTTVTIEEARGGSFYTYNFEDGRLTMKDSQSINVYTTDADDSLYSLDDVDGGYVRIEGDDVEVDVRDSNLNQLRISGDDAEISLDYAEVNDLEMGRWGELDLYRSFVDGEVGYGTDVYASYSRVILDLKDGNNDVTLKGGQALIDAANGQVDHFVFKGNVKVDGSFDAPDIFELESGAIWTAAELTAFDTDGGIAFIDIEGQFELAAYVESYDDFGGKG
jgi:hypothetical protein